MKVLMFIVIFFLIGACFIISENNLHLSDESEFKEFNVLYLSWLGNIFGNLQETTGYLVKFDWLPE